MKQFLLCGLVAGLLAAPAFADDAAPAAAPAATATPEPALPPTVGGGAGEAAPTAPAAASPVAPPAPAEAGGGAAANGANAGLDARVQDIKGEVMEVNRDLMVLEEDLLFPANTQLAVFLSMDVGKLFALDSVEVKIDDKEVANYLYTPAEVQALHRGGVQRLYLGNLRSGSHELVAFFVGKGTHERDYRRGATVKFDKGTDAKYIELRIKDDAGKLQPEFAVKVWQ